MNSMNWSGQKKQKNMKIIYGKKVGAKTAREPGRK